MSRRPAPIVGHAAAGAVLLALNLPATAPAAERAPGGLDDSFGDHGKVVTRVDSSGIVVSDAVGAPRGGVTVAANTAVQGRLAAGGRVVLLRYDRAGRLVKRFGRRGVLTMALAEGRATVAAMTRQPDGRLLIVGAVIPRGGGQSQDLLVARLRPNGALDTTFGEGGVRTVDFGIDSGQAADVAVQNDGSVVVVGSIDTQLSQTFGSAGLRDLLVIRLTSQGDLDQAFADGGIFRVVADDTGESFDARAVELGRNDDILVGGSSGLVHRDVNYPIVARIMSDGSPDPSVGSLAPGVAVLNQQAATVRDMALDGRTGRLYLAGDAFSETPQRHSFFIAAVRPDLTLSTEFSGDGRATTSFGPHSMDQATSVVVDGRGGVLLAGGTVRGARSRFAFARFTAAGELDDRFGRQGRLAVRVGGRTSFARALHPQSGGRVLAVGSVGVDSDDLENPGRAVGLARLAPPP